MAFLLLLSALILLAVLAPIAGVDSRDFDDLDGPRRDKLWSRRQ